MIWIEIKETLLENMFSCDQIITKNDWNLNVCVFCIIGVHVE